jgi:hypothetical protein
MHAAAEAYWIGRAQVIGEMLGAGSAPPTKDQALAVLDAIVDAGGWRKADAEFDDYANAPDTEENDSPLGELLAVAFGPWTEEDEAKDTQDQDTHGEHWQKKIYEPFRERYKFC